MRVPQGGVNRPRVHGTWFMASATLTDQAGQHETGIAAIMPGRGKQDQTEKIERPPAAAQHRVFPGLCPDMRPPGAAAGPRRPGHRAGPTRAGAAAGAGPAPRTAAAAVGPGRPDLAVHRWGERGTRPWRVLPPAGRGGVCAGQRRPASRAGVAVGRVATPRRWGSSTTTWPCCSSNTAADSTPAWGGLGRPAPDARPRGCRHRDWWGTARRWR